MTIWIALTYMPKLRGIIDGTIRQTIRTTTRFKEGDQIAFHGWSGKPYRSPWSFRTNPFRLVRVDNFIIFPRGIKTEIDIDVLPWEHGLCDQLAILDGIVPEDNETMGQAFGRVINSLNTIPEAGVKAQILRW
ncbi:MAG: hypothetical protein LUQ71_10410 [Methanoregula sp.]|nr:hypothetical protein [Methanoregula sp.]